MPPFCEFFNSHDCRDAESWVVLLDCNGVPHEALQLGIIPSHLECKMALGVAIIHADSEEIVHGTQLCQAVVV